MGRSGLDAAQDLANDGEFVYAPSPMRTSCALGLLLALAGAPGFAQPPKPGATPEPEAKHSGAPLGQFTAGPFIVTPTFKIGSLAVDTNVYYRTERTADFVASGGPGLDVALPFLDHWKWDVQGSSEYFYFQKNKQLRRWTGGGVSTLIWRDTGTEVTLSGRVLKDFSRPSFEVDSRVATDQRHGGASVERDLGRLTMVATLGYSGIRVDPGQEFRGANLTTTLTTDRYRGGGEFRLALTPVSSLVVEGAYEQTRFPLAPARNFSEENAGLGLDTKGFFKGRATAGVRSARLLQGGVSKIRPYFRGDLTQQLGRRFKLAERYTQESAVSAFAAEGGLPTYEHKSLDLNLAIQITNRIDMRLGGARDRIISDGLVQVVLDDGTPSTAQRDDLAYIARADLGMRLGRARMSVFGTYTTRQSIYFSDFGIDGLQAGARVEYAPQR